METVKDVSFIYIVSARVEFALLDPICEQCSQGTKVRDIVDNLIDRLCKLFLTNTRPCIVPIVSCNCVSITLFVCADMLTDT